MIHYETMNWSKGIGFFKLKFENVGSSDTLIESFGKHALETSLCCSLYFLDSTAISIG